MNKYTINYYDNNVIGLYFDHKQKEVFIDSKFESLVKSKIWNLKINNNAETLYYTKTSSDNKRSLVYWKRAILNATENDHVHYVTDNVYDLREANLFKLPAHTNKKQIQRVREQKLNNYVSPLTYKEPVAKSKWTIGTLHTDSPRIMLCNLENSQIYQLEGSLTEKDIEILSKILNTSNFTL